MAYADFWNSMGNMMGNYPAFGVIGIIAAVFWLLVFVAVLLAIIWLYRGITRGDTQTDDALRVLKLRYAKGEITRKEYDEMRRELG